MTPQTVILTDVFSGDTIQLNNAITKYCCNCDANINFSKRQLF